MHLVPSDRVVYFPVPLPDRGQRVAAQKGGIVGKEVVEQVWGISRPVMEQQIGRFQGFLADRGDLIRRCQALEDLGTFRPRDQVEEDSSWKQVIPYMVLRHDQQILQLRRLSTQGEARLHHRISIGVGGHVNPEPGAHEPLLLRGMRRELAEEICIDAQSVQFRLLGWINDDETEVGQVHLGLAVEAFLDHRPEIRETDRMEGTWQRLDRIDATDPAWESWSALLLSALESDPSVAERNISHLK